MYALTEKATLALFYIQRYRYLSGAQVARVVGMRPDHTAKQLRDMELKGYLAHFGNISVPGRGSVPKVYLLTRKGWETLRRESDIPEEMIGTHKEVKVDSRWSPQMHHRLRTIDLILAAEIAVRARPTLNLVRTFLEYRRVKRGTRLARETTDYVGPEETSANRIVPDAAFVLENIESGRRGLFFIEMDMATERIVSTITRDSSITLRWKLGQYDRYVQSGRFAKTYAAYGDFKGFTLLFVTLGDERVENVRNSMHDLPAELANFYRFTTFDRAMTDFLGPIWLSRSHTDTQRYPLAR